MNYAIIILSILAVWMFWGFFTSRVEQAEYSVVREMTDYEIREYPEHIVAQTTVEGDYESSLNQGFRIIAGYIFGGNSKKQGIAMTAPVTEQASVAETIAMTAPVQATTEGAAHVISFVMPRGFTLETLPTPKDNRVEIVAVPAKKFAVVRFSWSGKQSRIRKMQTKLLAALSRDGVRTKGTPVYAGYNPPWTPPWMERHEVMVEIAD